MVAKQPQNTSSEQTSTNAERQKAPSWENVFFIVVHGFIEIHVRTGSAFATEPHISIRMVIFSQYLHLSQDSK